MGMPCSVVSMFYGQGVLTDLYIHIPLGTLYHPLLIHGHYLVIRSTSFYQIIFV